MPSMAMWVAHETFKQVDINIKFYDPIMNNTCDYKLIIENELCRLVHSRIIGKKVDRYKQLSYGYACDPVSPFNNLYFMSKSVK